MSPVIRGGVLVGQQLPIKPATQQSASLVVRAVPIANSQSNLLIHTISNRTHYIHIGGINKRSDAIYLLPHGGQLLAEGCRPGHHHDELSTMHNAPAVN